jgi:hypothetical protein
LLTNAENAGRQLLKMAETAKKLLKMLKILKGRLA